MLGRVYEYAARARVCVCMCVCAKYLARMREEFFQECARFGGGWVML